MGRVGIGVTLLRADGTATYQLATVADDLDLGHILDVAVDDRGDVFLLTVRDARSAIVRCDYRGRVLGTVPLTTAFARSCNTTMAVLSDRLPADDGSVGCRA